MARVILDLKEELGTTVVSRLLQVHCEERLLERFFEDKEKLLEEEDSLRAVWLILVTIFAFLAVFLVINMAIFILL